MELAGKIVSEYLRCPKEEGGCGQLVGFLFESGLCAGCDAAKAKRTGNGAVKRRMPARNRDEKTPGEILIEQVRPVEAHHQKKRPGRKPDPAKCRKFVLGEAGTCARCGGDGQSHRQKRKYSRRPKPGPTGPLAGICKADERFRAPVPIEAKETDDSKALRKLKGLRATYQCEFELATAQMNAWLSKLEVLDEVEAALKA